MRLVEQGNYGDYKVLTGYKGLFELRFNFGPGYRIYCYEDGNILLVLLAGGDKRSQAKDIKRAAEYLKHYKELK